MSKSLCAFLVLVSVAAYSCGGSDTRDPKTAPSAGQAGDDARGDSSLGGAASGIGGARVRLGGAAGESGSGVAGAAGSPAPGDAEQGGVGGDTARNEGGGGAAGESVAAGGESAGTGGESAGAGGEGAGGAAAIQLADAPIVNVPYTCRSPFDGVDFGSYFYLENWEDGLLSTPGATPSSTILSSSFGVPTLIDSVDCDDGVIDGTCLDCDALFANGTIEVSFDALVLGALPTHVGLVWTDGGYGTSVTITGYDAAGAVIYGFGATVPGVGDNDNFNTVGEDRFFGIVHYAGVQRVVVTNASGGVEVDHLQYGR